MPEYSIRDTVAAIEHLRTSIEVLEMVQGVFCEGHIDDQIQKAVNDEVARLWKLVDGLVEQMRHAATSRNWEV